MTRETRVQAAVLRGGEILLLEMAIDDGRRFWLLPGGGVEAGDADESAAIAREVHEETSLSVIVDRMLLDRPAAAADTAYRRYRTFLCIPQAGSLPVAGARDGIAVIDRVLWLRLDDDASWEPSVKADAFLLPQLLDIRAALDRLNRGRSV
jgi:8-oxo-dGTP pyrophosphatase MutT (NUDIX family)